VIATGDLDDGRRVRRTACPAQTSRAARWLATALVSLVLLSWVATLYVLVLVADGLSETNSHVDWWAHIIAVALIAVTIKPVRRWVRLAVDDVVYGHLDDAYTVMTELNRQIDVAAPADPTGTDPSLARMIARTLNVPYVAIVDGDTETSVVGLRPSDRDLADVPLTYQGTEIGHLYVAPRRPGTTLSNRDLALLSDLAQQLAVALYAIRASEQVQASRAALVTAREEERRRIRRDLHDGLGPNLASMKLQLTAVARLLEAEPARAADLLGEVREGMDDTTADIRRLVYGLRPPLIDELGLIAALRNHPSVHSGLEVTVHPEQLPELPAAVEVALYRIASEAIHNAVRHSGGRRCQVNIAVAADEVQMTICDDGRGLPDPLVDGVGVSAIRERAAELGGTVELTSNGGTTITTVVPLRPSAMP
jgi:two-component system, NarL family, sensor kinase